MPMATPGTPARSEPPAASADDRSISERRSMVFIREILAVSHTLTQTGSRRCWNPHCQDLP